MAIEHDEAKQNSSTYHIIKKLGKRTMATRLPRRLEEKMKIVGEQIKLARLRRQKTASFFDCNLGKVRFCQIFDLFCQFGSKITGFF